ncbi:hypothetical protein E7T09_15755 [Deinococcus sp. KSM4-11]|uniref:hypothetical protein n=1 Tax=Deinococcus sp. KSM4-11 TaxID=2568654 RepID=UPI0010A41E9A|nr:hypothetical protein [Deinococcus sp. KSM4-11]THF85423.1 hypothetical protein E7T09_15755 [Deinococcus sp. KSM4-11]
MPLDEAEVRLEIRIRHMQTLELDGTPGPNVMLRDCIGIDLHPQDDGTWMIGWRTLFGRQFLIPLAPFTTQEDAVACAHRIRVVMVQTLEEWNAQQDRQDPPLT